MNTPRQLQHYRGCRGKGRVILRHTLIGIQWRCTECGDFVYLEPPAPSFVDNIRGSNLHYSDLLHLTVTVFGRPLPKGMSPGVVGFWVRKRR